jgi:antitoxin CptB
MSPPQLKKKLKFQSWHRGTKENDLLLGPFCDNQLAFFSPSQVALFQKFLTESDPDIFNWIVHKIPPPKIYEALIHHIIEYHVPK